MFGAIVTYAALFCIDEACCAPFEFEYFLVQFPSVSLQNRGLLHMIFGLQRKSICVFLETEQFFVVLRIVIPSYLIRTSLHVQIC